jgi:hypothetical protein
METKITLNALAVVAGLALCQSAAHAQVDAGDYILWRKNYGYDCNADRKIDASDYAIWRSRYGTAVRTNSPNTALGQWKGSDLNCNGRVDAADYVVWRKTLGY